MKALSKHQITDLVDIRHTLHAAPEISGEEEKTAAYIAGQLREIGADRVVSGLGGHGVLAEYKGKAGGPTVMIRCELDGLPIQEISRAAYRSRVEGKGHLCGHDGHMTMVLGIAKMLAEKRPAMGRVILMFQPAEETGAGAVAVIADPKFAEFRPDYAFSLHNLPGRPLGEVSICRSVANCASRGMQIVLTGKSSHAAAPEDGVSPGPALSVLMPELACLGQGGEMNDQFSLSTLTHARLGEPTFGIAPGFGEVRVTLRSISDDLMAAMVANAEKCVAAAATGLEVDISWHDIFLAGVNDPDCRDRIITAARARGAVLRELDYPMRWSEDFGRFGLDGAKSAMFFLGSGEDQPQLHNPDYDFPDEIIPVGTGLFLELIDQLLEL
ncbi:amidohydrolase [Pseudovibrio sp. Tun.PSC04-5.I4]|uniref:amidohydrolase n=1 Tax=Pseudovibrio sp. Tun.PSC04-5.I4 TaxID=1798213 RepID=UPI00088E0E8D|nr:amidohydrolase [Pseudovibrio sp. Tun.PSC04-5.I4]SDR40116.1 amidohydrolase [Pseudovibrio sp. Tun.PSC04-5.I4]